LARVKEWKIPVDVAQIRRIFDENELSIRGIDRCDAIKLSEKTVRRGMKDGEMSLKTVIELAKFLGVSPSHFSKV
jgi:hypothetical protein